MSTCDESKEILLANKPPFLNILGFEDCFFDEKAELFTAVFTPNVDMTHSKGTIVQGGFISGMLDSAMAQIVLYKHKFKVNPLTLKMDVTFILPCKPEQVCCESKILKMGKSIVFTLAEMKQNNEIIATASATSKLIYL